MSVSLLPGIISAAMHSRNSVIAVWTPWMVVSRSLLMLVIATFMFEPAKLAMNWVKASGISSFRGEMPDPGSFGPLVSAGALSATSASLFRRRDRARSDDQCQVAERLGEVSDLPPASHVVLLREQAEIVTQAQQPLKQRASLLNASVERERAYQPKRARQELPFVSREAVVGLGSGIAGDEPVATELARDRVDRPGDTLIVSW